MTKTPPIDPVAEVAALMVERRIDDRIVYSRVWLSQITSGAAPIPVNDRRRLRMLAEALRCQPFYLDKLVSEWNAYQAGEAIEEPAAPAPKQHDRAQMIEKALAADAAKGALPRKLCTACAQEKSITEFYEHGAQCKVCRRAKVIAYREAHPKKKRPLPGIISWSGTYWAPPSES